MAAFWLAAIPSSIWATKTLGNTINEALFRQSRAEPPNPLLDHEGALACAEAVLNFHPISPTASHLRELVKQSADKLAKLVKDTEARIEKHSWSRIFRDPDFSRENQATTAEIETLKSRVSLFLNVMQMFPRQSDKAPFEKSLPEDHESIDSEEEGGECISNSNSVTDSLSSEENLQPVEMSFWQALSGVGWNGLSSGLASPDDSGDQDGDEHARGAQNDQREH